MLKCYSAVRLPDSLPQGTQPSCTKSQQQQHQREQQQQQQQQQQRQRQLRHDAGRTPLGIAAGMGDEDAWFELLDAGHQPQADVDTYGETVLHLAAAYGQVEMLVLMQEHNLNVNACNHEGWTPLFSAVASGRIEAAAFLVDKLHANISHVTLCGNTLLHVAAWYGAAASVEWLLACGLADVVGALNQYGCRAFDMAPPGPIRAMLLAAERSCNSQ